MKLGIEFAYLILFLILSIIILAHCVWVIEQKNKKWICLLIILSAVLFIIIFVEHFLYVSKNNNNSHSMENNLNQIKYNGFFNPYNNAMRLLMNLSKHPIFVSL